MTNVGDRLLAALVAGPRSTSDLAAETGMPHDRAYHALCTMYVRRLVDRRILVADQGHARECIWWLKGVQ